MQNIPSNHNLTIGYPIAIASGSAPIIFKMSSSKANPTNPIKN